MPAKTKKNYRAMAHSDDLSILAVRIHKSVVKGEHVGQADLDALIRLSNDLVRELRPAPMAPDAFLVDKLPTQQVPAVEPVPVNATPIKEPEPATKKKIGR